MKVRVSLVIITKNAEELLEKTLSSVKGIVSEIILVDDSSIDKTLDIAQKYNCVIYKHHERNLGLQKQYAINKAKEEWILILDSDEYLSDNLQKEIKEVLNNKIRFNGFYIPYQNHFLGKPIHYGGEDYKMIRLAKKTLSMMESSLVHESLYVNKENVGYLKHPIMHFSYRSLSQMYKKFTDYALREVEIKRKKGEKTSFKKIFLYPIHMFWARFIKDKGYKDGLLRFPLDLGFAYMEFLTYFKLLFSK